MPRISQLPSLTTADNADEIAIVDVSASTTKKITRGDLLKAPLPTKSVTLPAINGGSTAGVLTTDASGNVAAATVWWEEVGRTTLSSAGDTITVGSLPARKYLLIIFSILPTGGTIGANLTFNGDTANNYALRVSNAGAADSTSVSRANWSYFIAAGAYPIYAETTVMNIASQEKLGIYHTVEQGAAGGANWPTRTERVAKWANTSAQISSIVVTNDGTGDFAIGSEVIVLGHN